LYEWSTQAIKLCCKFRVTILPGHQLKILLVTEVFWPSPVYW